MFSNNFYVKLYKFTGILVGDFVLTMMMANINPIALRKTKIVYNFGLSECNGVTRLW